MTEETMESRIALQRKLDVLKKNREVVSETELREKYGRAYAVLLDEIHQLKKQFITERVKGIYVHKNDSCVVDIWNGYLNKINAALYEEYSVEKAEFYLEELVSALFVECNSIQISTHSDD